MVCILDPGPGRHWQLNIQTCGASYVLDFHLSTAAPLIPGTSLFVWLTWILWQVHLPGESVKTEGISCQWGLDWEALDGLALGWCGLGARQYLHRGWHPAKGRPNLGSFSMSLVRNTCCLILTISFHMPFKLLLSRRKEEKILHYTFWPCGGQVFLHSSLTS